jgi:hypothetical protein
MVGIVPFSEKHIMWNQLVIFLILLVHLKSPEVTIPIQDLLELLTLAPPQTCKRSLIFLKENL